MTPACRRLAVWLLAATALPFLPSAPAQADAPPPGNGPAAPAVAPRTMAGNALPAGTILGEFELLRVLGERLLDVPWLYRGDGMDAGLM